MKKIKSWVIVLYAFVGLCNSYIANDKPILASNKGDLSSPCTKDFLYDLGILEKTLYNPTVKYDWVISPIIPYHAQSINVDASKYRPFEHVTRGHLLGTDHLGRDVLAGLVRGCFNSFKIGLFAVLFSLLIGVIIGSAMAYFGDKMIRLTYTKFVLMLMIALLGIYYTIYSILLGWKIIASIMSALLLLALSHWDFLNKGRKLIFPLDSLANNIIILRKSIPTLLLILAFLPLFSEPHASNIILILALIGWTNIARHTRAASLSILQQEYIQSTKLLGAGYWHITKYQLWPLIKPTIGVVAGFAFSSYLVIEASLSFLGIGLPPEEVSWGSMIGLARSDISMWWVVVFPSIALFIIIYCFATLFENKLAHTDESF